MPYFWQFFMGQNFDIIWLSRSLTMKFENFITNNWKFYDLESVAFSDLAGGCQFIPRISGSKNGRIKKLFRCVQTEKSCTKTLFPQRPKAKDSHRHDEKSTKTIKMHNNTINNPIQTQRKTRMKTTKPHKKTVKSSDWYDENSHWYDEANLVWWDQMGKTKPHRHCKPIWPSMFCSGLNFFVQPCRQWWYNRTP